MPTASDELLLDLAVDNSPSPAVLPRPSPPRSDFASLLLDITPAREWLIDDIFLPAFRPLIPEQNVWQWSDADNVFLDSRAAPKPGWYRSRKTPHCREFMETFTDPAWTEDLVIKCSRSGFTEASLCQIRFMPQNAPGDALYAIDSRDEAKQISKNRLESTMRAAAGDEFPENPDDDGILTKYLRNMTLYLSGSYSPGMFRNKGLRAVWLDECEVKNVIADEGSTFDLATSRIDRHPNGKLFATSKPKKPNTAFHKRWASGTRSVWLVPCPHCGTYQEFTFFGDTATENLKLDPDPKHPDTTPEPLASPPRLGRIVFSHCKDLLDQWDRPRILKETYYECLNGCRINENDTLDATRHAWIFDVSDAPDSNPGAHEVHTRLLAGERLTTKAAIMLAGHWLRTNPRPHPKRRSRHISDICTLDPEMDWGQLALTFVDCGGDTEKLMHFYNNHLGYVWRAARAALTEEIVLELRTPLYKRGTCPFIPDLVTLTFDTQQFDYVPVIMAWQVDGTAAIIDWFTALADLDITRRFDLDIPVLEKPIHGPQPLPGQIPGPVRVQYALGDAGGKKGRTADVYDLCLSMPGRIYPSFGRGGRQITTPIAERKTEHRLQTLIYYAFSDLTFKNKLYLDRIGRIKEIKKAQAEGKDPVLFNLPPRLYIPNDADKQLVRELAGERQDADGEWEDPAPGPNHFGDAVKLGYVLFEWLLPRIKASKEKARRDAEAAQKKTA